MNFDEIDNLSPEEIEKMYFDVLDTEGNIRLAVCCCQSGTSARNCADRGAWCRAHITGSCDWSHCC